MVYDGVVKVGVVFVLSAVIRILWRARHAMHAERDEISQKDGRSYFEHTTHLLHLLVILRALVLLLLLIVRASTSRYICCQRSAHRSSAHYLYSTRQIRH